MASKKIKLFTQWKEGDICIAKYHRNNKWYRGKVLQVVPQYNDKAKLNVRNSTIVHLLFLFVSFTIFAKTYGSHFRYCSLIMEIEKNVNLKR